MLNTLTIPLQLVCQLVVPGNIDAGNLTAPAVSVPLSPPQAQPVLPPGFTAFSDIGVAYKHFNDTVTWNSARKVCISHDSKLAAIDSLDKINAAQSIRRDNVGGGAFLGIHRQFGDCEWLNLETGLPITEIPWAPEKLDDTNRNCLALWPDGRGVSAMPCDQLRTFFCEVPLLAAEK